jgi:uncharacterized protein DUF6285
MKDISNAADLISAARDALTRDLLPLLSKEQRYVGLMIASAMAIALREVQSAADAERGEARRLRALLAIEFGEVEVGGEHGDGEASQAALPTLRRKMRQAIRAGRFDDGEDAAALSAHLALTAAAWVAISNPKALHATAS